MIKFCSEWSVFYINIFHSLFEGWKRWREVINKEKKKNRLYTMEFLLLDAEIF